MMPSIGSLKSSRRSMTSRNGIILAGALSLAAIWGIHADVIAGSAKATTVSESERMIPLSYDVDVIVVGGTLRGVAAAQTAAKAGCKVFLCEDRPYLGVDVCGTYRLWLESGEEPKTKLGRAIYGKATGQGSRSIVTPMMVKSALDNALLNSKVDMILRLVNEK